MEYENFEQIEQIIGKIKKHQKGLSRTDLQSRIDNLKSMLKLL
jgi:hypothetical protein